MERHLQKSPLANNVSTKNSFPETIYMHSRSKTHAAKKVTSWSTNPKNFRFAQVLEKQVLHWWLFKDSLLLWWHVQPFFFTTKTLYKLQGFASHFLSTYKYIFDQFRPFPGNRTHDLDIMLNCLSHRNSRPLVPSPRKTIHTLSPWQRHKQTNGAIQTGANT